MPRALISTPKDNVAGLFSPPRDAAWRDAWQEQEEARRREAYAEELKAQILAKEISKQTEKLDNSVSDSIPARKAHSSEASMHSKSLGFENEAEYLKVPPAIHTRPPHVSSSTTTAATEVQYSRYPQQQQQQEEMNSPSPLSHHQPPQTMMTEKERFIAAMERGITKSPKKAAIESMAMPFVHRNATAPVPTATAMAASGAVVATPFGRSFTAEEEAAEALQRQHKFKMELENQIQERKRLKKLEAERERQWEAEQEARLEKEREKLRRDFEAEHAALRAKVAADDAANAAAADLKKGKTQAGDDAGVQIFASKVKFTNQRPTAASRSESAVDPEALMKKTAPSANEQNLNEESLIITIPHKNDSPQLQTGIHTYVSPPSAAAAATQASLAEQIAELRGLQEALQRDLSLHKSVLELVKDARIAATQPPQQPFQAPAVLPSVLTYTAAPIQAPAMQPFPVYATAAAMQPGQPYLAGAKVPIITTTTNKQPSIPILYTSGVLRTEETRPPTAYMSRPVHSSTNCGTHQRQQQHAQELHSRLAAHASTQSQTHGGNTWVKSTHSNSGSRKKVAVGQGGSLPPIHEQDIETRASESKQQHKSPTAAAPQLATTSVTPARAAERLSIWKKAQRKLRKLSVAKTTGSREATWIVKEEPGPSSTY